MSGFSVADEPTCPLKEAIEKYNGHTITVKLKVARDVDEKLDAVITKNGKCMKVNKPDKEGYITLQATAEQLKSFHIVNKDGEYVQAGQVISKEIAPQRTQVVTSRVPYTIRGQTFYKTVTGRVTHPARAEIQLNVSRRDANSAGKH